MDGSAFEEDVAKRRNRLSAFINSFKHSRPRVFIDFHFATAPRSLMDTDGQPGEHAKTKKWHSHCWNYYRRMFT